MLSSLRNPPLAERQCLFALTLYLTNVQDSICLADIVSKFFETPNVVVASLVANFKRYLPNSSLMYKVEDI